MNFRRLACTRPLRKWISGSRVGELKTNCPRRNATSHLCTGGYPRLQRLRDFLLSKNPDAARRAGEAIRRGVQALGTHPRMGRLIEDFPEQYREWTIDFGDSGYLAPYRFDGDAVMILAVRHQKEAGY
ncbi:type II toxin-antitoxin system RelE/ParE family toxin [Burkholderia ambifaria]|nr:type II toxin-antitoxin system RelE/ParE family toxin [Burkholderia ambifaria]